jgi:glycosyltransferase involved in cell wall biosynthesis
MLRVGARYFAAAKISCDILSTGNEVVGPYAPSLEAAGFRIHHLPFSKTFGFFWRFRRLVAAGNYDIVHLHTERASLWLAISAFRLAGIVRTVHNNFNFTGWLRQRRRFGRWLSRLLGVRHLAISPSVQMTERRQFANPTTLCPNWYDSDHFRPPSEMERAEARKKFDLTPDVVALASIGNCAAVKNHHVLIEALARLKHYPKLVYLHAGREVPARDEFNLATRLGVADRVRFLGSLADVRPLLQAADLFVMPSLYEGFSIAALEALACGVPALLADVPGLRDLSRWFPQLLYAPPTTDGLVAQIEAFLNLPAGQRVDLAVSYPAAAKENFGAAEGVRRYCMMYNDTTLS